MVIYNFIDFNPNSRLEMFNILSGKIEFHPGMKIRAGQSIKAPSLHKRQNNRALRIENSTFNKNIDDKRKKELNLMLSYINAPTTDEEM